MPVPTPKADPLVDADDTGGTPLGDMILVLVLSAFIRDGRVMVTIAR